MAYIERTDATDLLSCATLISQNTLGLRKKDLLDCLAIQKRAPIHSFISSCASGDAIWQNMRKQFEGDRQEQVYLVPIQI